jgi:hypothetical protein
MARLRHSAAGPMSTEKRIRILMEALNHSQYRTRRDPSERHRQQPYRGGEKAWTPQMTVQQEKR